MDADDVAIRCEGLTKRYGSTLAVDGLDLVVEPGQVYGFLGPNGAGKTTTIRMLLGLVRPTDGRAWVQGRPLPDAREAATIGSMIEEPAFYPWMTGRANLRLVRSLRYGGAVGLSAVEVALQSTGLVDVAGRKVKTYSQGMRQRLGLAAALLGQPSLLVLDEPTNGLDPAGIREVRALLRSFVAGGGTVFLSSHLLAEVEQVCDRAAVVAHGRLIEEGPVGSLGVGGAGRRVRVTVERGDVGRAVAALAVWSPVMCGPTIEVDHGVGRDVNGALVAADIVADTIEVVRAGLEERFLELTEEPPATTTTPAAGHRRAAGR